MRIVSAHFSAGAAGFFFDDQRAIRDGAVENGFVYAGEPVTPGYSSIRTAGESISAVLRLENGALAVGDCAAVQYSGTGGRDPLFLAERYLPFLRERVGPLLAGMEIGPFREMAQRFDALEVDGRRLHTAIRYGLTQALLAARARERGVLEVEVLCEEYGLPLVLEPVPIFGQCGDERYTGVDKMILKRVDVLPHGLINSIETKVGRRGEKLLAYVGWLARRIREIREDPGYRPTLHIDVYGTIGIIFSGDVDRIVGYLCELESATEGLPLYIEGPIDMGEREAQMRRLGEIRNALAQRGSGVRIVADEWCNTLEDIRQFAGSGCCDMVQIKTPDLGGIQNVVESVILCRECDVEAYQGGTCNETDVSARVCVHLALAARPERMLAKPGMGFDEGFMIVRNEMARTLTLLRAKEGGGGDGM